MRNILKLFSLGRKAAPTLSKSTALEVWKPAVKKAPGIISKILRTAGGTGSIRKWPFYLGGIGLGTVALSKMYNDDAGAGFQYTAEDINKALGAGASPESLLQNYINSQRALITGQGDDAYNKYASGLQGSLQNYLGGIGGYSAAQGAAIEKAYADLAEQSRGLAEQAMSESQMAASDIDRLYGDAATAAAGYGAGQGLTGTPSDVSGLTGVSGAMAEAPDTTRTYGQSLADWMGRQGIIQRQDLESAAQSYLAQGLGTKSQMQAEAAALQSKAQYDLANRLSEMEFARQQQRAEQLFGLDQQLAQAKLQSDIEAAQLAKQSGLLSLQAPMYWESIKSDEGTRNMWKALGVTDAESLKNALIARPELAQLLGS